VEGEAKRALLGQMWSWAAEIEGVAVALRKRPGSMGRLLRMGLAQLERKFIYFPNFIFSTKTIPGKPRNCLKALKILRKSQKFHKNFQR
jgi:hypothetical protein